MKNQWLFSLFNCTVRQNIYERDQKRYLNKDMCCYRLLIACMYARNKALRKPRLIWEYKKDKRMFSVINMWLKWCYTFSLRDITLLRINKWRIISFHFFLQCFQTWRQYASVRMVGVFEKFEFVFLIHTPYFHLTLKDGINTYFKLAILGWHIK